MFICIRSMIPLHLHIVLFFVQIMSYSGIYAGIDPHGARRLIRIALPGIELQIHIFDTGTRMPSRSMTALKFGWT